MPGLKDKIRKGLSLLQSRRAYVCHVEPRLLDLLDADAAFLCSNLDLFRPLVPLPVPPPAKGPILVVGAHPDDEAVGAGGSLILARKRGARIAAAFATDGSSGPGPEEQEIGRIRRAEARAAAAALGAKAEFFRTPVRTLARSRDLAQEVSDWLKSLLERVKPRAVFCPFPLDAHTDHRLAAWALAGALTKEAGEPIIWAYEVASLCPANVVVDISGVEEEKAALIGKYSSQMARFDYVNVALGLNRFHSRHLGGRGAAEAFFRVPAREFKKLVERLSPEQLFKNETDP